MSDLAESKRAILVVDDEPFALLGMQGLFQMNGWDHVLCCSDSRQVPQLLADHDCGLMMLDWMMPHVDGLETLQEVRRHWPSLPVIVITAMDVEQVIEECRSYQVQAVLAKPVETAVLMKTVERLISDTLSD